MFWLTFNGYFVASFFFSSAEAAKFAVRDPSRLSPAAKSFIEDSDKSLATLVLGNNKANILVGQILGQMVASNVWEWLQGWPWAILMYALTVVLGEYVPKAIGEAYPEKVLNLYSPALNASAWGMTPLVWALSLLGKLLPKPPKNEDEEELVTAVLEMDDTPVDQVMLPAPQHPGEDAGEEELEEYHKLAQAYEAREERAESLIGHRPAKLANYLDGVSGVDIILNEGGAVYVIDKRGKRIGLLDERSVLEWMFDHLLKK